MMYEIRYLPLARGDLTNIINYISDRLYAPKAAMDLLKEFDISISRLRKFPYSYKVYRPIASLEEEYRILPVKNYVELYVIIDQVVEIRRIIYSKRDLTNIVKK